MGQCTEALFLRDVAEHQMTVIRDDGVNRHIRFIRPGSSSYYFDLITWPGYLCYTGDMGCYVFSRLDDMFEFFRTDRRSPKEGKTLNINPGYWSEKLRAVDSSGRHGVSAEEFDPDRFRELVIEQMRQWVRGDGRLESGVNSYGLNHEQRRELWDTVKEEVLDSAEDNEALATAAIYDFHHKTPDREFYFQDFFEHRLTRFTFHFEWCCYALAWAIEQYDNAKKAAAQAA